MVPLSPAEGGAKGLLEVSKDVNLVGPDVEVAGSGSGFGAFHDAEPGIAYRGGIAHGGADIESGVGGESDGAEPEVGFHEVAGRCGNVNAGRFARRSEYRRGTLDDVAITAGGDEEGLRTAVSGSGGDAFDGRTVGRPAALSVDATCGEGV